MRKLAGFTAVLVTWLTLGACAGPSDIPKRQANIPAPLPIVQEGPCCGPITPKGRHILDVLDASNVEHLWQRDTFVDWETGEPDMAGHKNMHPVDTHCSQFVAAMSVRLGVYLLRPPYHRESMLANAQGKWLRSAAGREAGWWRVDGPAQAQALANSGRFVAIVYESAPPDPDIHGHIVIVRPDAERTLAQIEKDGTEITQAGGHNHLRATEQHGFHSHHGAWPNGVEYFAHDLPNDHAVPAQSPRG